MMRLMTIIFLITISPMVSAKKTDLKNLEEKTVLVEEKENKIKLYFLGDYTTIASPSDGENLAGIGITLQGMYAVNERWGVGLAAWQSFSFSGTTVVTEIDGRVTYALTGKLSTTDTSTQIDNSKVLVMKDFDNSGFRLQYIRSQYYFNASTNTVPYSGNGFSAFYEHIGRNRFSYVGGVRFDMIANTEFTTSPLQIFFGIGINF